MLKEMRQDNNRIIIRVGQIYLNAVIIPYPNTASLEDVPLHPFHARIDTFRNLRRHQSM